MRANRLAGLFTGLALLGACSEGTNPSDSVLDSDDASNPPGDAILRVALTDAPSPYFEAVDVHIGTVEILPNDGPPVTVVEEAGTFDLLQLQNGVTASVAELPIEPGEYVQLRLIVDSATVTLKDDFEFNDGSQTQDLFIPSGAQTGIKINLDMADGDGEQAGITISGETILVIDFDVEQNFRIRGNPDTPAGINGVLFTPLLRAVVADVAGSISGTVTEGGNPVEGATVTAVLTESGALEELQTDEAGAVTDSDGTYTIHFLSPGTYSVTAQLDENTVSDPVDVELGDAEDKTDIDFAF